MKKLKVFLLLLFFIPFIVNAKAKYLYDILREEAENNIAKEYTGEHQDSMDASLSNNAIYYWNADSNDKVSEILSKNNVIFGGFCWQMIRTTDTGGVRLVYNGEVVDGKCLDSRGNHVGIKGLYTKAMNDVFYYGTDYTYDSSTNLFYLAGDKHSYSWNEANFNNIKNKYTCLSTNADDGCEKLYIPYTYYSDTYSNSFEISKNLPFSSVGESTFNYPNDSPAYAGYMYNKVYHWEKNDLLILHRPYTQTTTSNMYYSSEVTWDPSTNKYTLVNPQRVPTTSFDYNNLVGKYIIQTATSSNNKIEYVTCYYNYYLYSMTFYDGETVDTHQEYYSYASSYTDNGDGTFTLNNYTSFKRSDFGSNYESIVGKYFCLNTTGTGACEDLWYAKKTTPITVSYYDVKHPIKYANGFTYANGEYTLNDNSMTYWGTPSNLSNKRVANNYHYTCFNETGVCSQIAYIHHFDEHADYILLENGTDVETALVEMLSADDVNKNDSIIKYVVDKWYENNMQDYSVYIEDTIYCNSRYITSLGGWDPNGGSLFSPSAWLYFRGADLSCKNETDRFSLSNEKAKLTYPVALPITYEMNALGWPSVRKSVTAYRLLSPYMFFPSTERAYDIYHEYVEQNYGNINDAYPNSYGVRPMISLVPEMAADSGTGSKDDPYVISLHRRYKVNVEIKNETEDLTIELDAFTKVSAGEEVKFKVKPKKGYVLSNLKIMNDNSEVEYTKTDVDYEYSFIMPEHDVTIVPSYKRKASAVSVENNPHTREIVIEVNDSTAVIYEDKVVFSVEPEDGYEVEKIEIKDVEGNEIEYEKTENKNEYSFVMPDIDVIIKPTYRKLAINNVPDIPSNPNTGNKLLLIPLIMIMSLGLVIIFYKKERA